MPSPSAPVLLLDDCAADAQMLRRALRPLAPERRVGLVAEPDAALAWMEAHGGMGLLGLDWRLGRHTGADVLTALRARPACAGWRVVVLSGAELSDADRECARGLGAESILTKPMDLDGWSRVATQILRTECGPRDQREASLVAGALLASGQTNPLTMSTATLALPTTAPDALLSLLQGGGVNSLLTGLGQLISAGAAVLGGQVARGEELTPVQCDQEVRRVAGEKSIAVRELRSGRVGGSSWDHDRSARRRRAIIELFAVGVPMAYVEEEFVLGRTERYELAKEGERLRKSWTNCGRVAA